MRDTRIKTSTVESFGRRARVSSTDVTVFMKEFGISLDVNEWRLFIDSSKLSLKMVFLHYGDELPSIPIAYVPHMKETYTCSSSYTELSIRNMSGVSVLT
ncbi:hypothetical protein AVEN_2574-1 [Araneus ventricosus]|uniref:Uncharacterized protein n=1 Tax=Araneus ventricosus TaxID=182803 RepID=A0A4Y2GRT7_ARAVE|nr:hypothetical protein AVEN_2574-1 [Araneus ventricosus]